MTGYRLYQNGSQVGTPHRRSATSSAVLTCATNYTLRCGGGRWCGQRVDDRDDRASRRRRAPDTTAPSSPTGLTKSNVGPDAVATVGLDRLHGQCRSDWAIASTATAPRSGRQRRRRYTSRGLTCATSYTLGVAAVDGAGNVSGVASLSVTTAACADSVAPSIPAGLSTSGVGQSAVSLSWSASSDNVGVTGYRAYLNGGQVGTSSSTSYAFSGLSVCDGVIRWVWLRLMRLGMCRGWRRRR